MNTNKRPWEYWVPGALSKNQVKSLHRLGLIRLRGKGALEIGACSVDLSLSGQGFRMRDGSVKPSTKYSYDRVLKDRLPQAKDGSFELRRKRTYVFKLREQLNPRIGFAGIHGQATAKSSIGRLDVLARLIVDGMDRYECFDPDHLKKSSGRMYLEITPITFNVKVRPGLCMTQLRLFYGDPRDSEITGEELCRTVLGPQSMDRVLTLNLEPEQFDSIRVAAFSAKTAKSSRSPIPLWAKKTEYPWKYWKFVGLDRQKRLKIRPGQFYILRSKERLYVPNGVAIYCKAIDETIGEMRIHYAGFVHPGFGMKRRDRLRGTPLIFEVRGHQVRAVLSDGEKMANIVFYRMSSQDSESLEVNKSYNNQNLQLSNIFKKWPKKLRVDGEGNVAPR
jgi:dCTP deaminase